MAVGVDAGVGLPVGVGVWVIVEVSGLVGVGAAAGCGLSSHAEDAEVAIKHRTVMQKIDHADRLRLFRPAILSYIGNLHQVVFDRVHPFSGAGVGADLSASLPTRISHATLMISPMPIPSITGGMLSAMSICSEAQYTNPTPTEVESLAQTDRNRLRMGACNTSCR